MKNLGFAFFALVFLNCSPSMSKNNIEEEGVTKKEVSKQETQEEEISILRQTDTDYSKLSESDWKKILTPEEFHVLREKGTERAFTGTLLSNKSEGIYVCKGCGTDLFNSSTKFKSGTGWPSFYDEIDNNVEEKKDNSYGMERVELVCITCKGHLGHVFTDGPNPTGLRYCINSLSLSFKEKNN